MSRIIVKNLPLNVDEKKFKEHFVNGPNGRVFTITDLKLVRTKDGRSRRFGFVGYSGDDEAAEAVKHFNMTYLGTTRLQVDLAMSLKDKRKRTEENEREQELITAKRSKDGRYDHGSSEKGSNFKDEKLEEFMNLMKPRQEKNTWANDIALGEQQSTGEAPISRTSAATSLPAEDDDSEYEDIPAKQTLDPIEDDNEPMISLSSIDENNNNKENSSVDVTNDATNTVEESNNLAADENISDMEWLRMRRERIKEGQEAEADAVGVPEDGEEQDPSLDSKPKVSKKESPTKSETELAMDKIYQTKRLFLRNLSYDSTEDQFRELFSKYGNIDEVHLPIDPKTNKSKGFLYIQFANPEDAVDAYENEDGNVFHGRILHILPADPKRTEHRLDEFDMKNLPLKKQKELKRKAAASKQQFSWNSLYLNSDAVMESVASRLGVSKSELINPDSADSAVKQAIAETSVINNIKQYFESKNVNLESFNQKEKSDLLILVKNFPFNTSIDEINDLFAQYGDIDRVLMPPDGGIAMVVFKSAPQARAAFAKLAYRRFKTSILYLEKGPKGLFENSETVKDDGTVADVSNVTKTTKISAADVLESKQETSEETYSGPTVSIFIKNLSFSTTSQELAKSFKSLEGFASAKVQMKPDTKNPGKFLSMGFGFVEFKNKEYADIAVDVMQGHVLGGHQLQLKLSHRGNETGSESTPTLTSKPKNKIIVKNIPFEATRKDIQQLLGAFGQLRSLRLPQKFNKSARGFAFAEFVTSKEAESAMKALQGTHLLGRRLVMEYAQQDAANAEEELARLEAKVQKQVTKETLHGLRLTGKRQLDLEDDDDNSLE